MPGYGVVGETEGAGLLPWSWAEERLDRAHDYWLATASAAARPHVMPVWGMWHDGALWFSCSGGSRKTRNLLANARCSIATDDPAEPVVLEGTAEVVDDLSALRRVLELENAKYGTAYGMEMFDPAVNTTFRFRAEVVFGLDTSDFTGSPTRWTFA
ncbi:MAG: pyridoxamine 5'-phosphate oxidase family protein [Actinobacteria bacterium]|nr:pyridoxamine 5'-phosphate oxidase family protein [Actinomycetota bacterium]